jgi:hypothetical protein
MKKPNNIVFGLFGPKYNTLYIRVNIVIWFEKYLITCDLGKVVGLAGLGGESTYRFE